MHLTLKIQIDDIKPAIWRRVVVNDELTLQQLHNVIQVSFNWQASHLYMYQIAGYTMQ